MGYADPEGRRLWEERNPDYIDNQRKAGVHMLYGARRRSKRKGHVCDITLEDIVIPEVCPVLGIPLEFGERYAYNTPSLDRIDNSKGYIKGNVRVISYRANTLKRDMTAEEAVLVAEDLQRIADHNPNKGAPRGLQELNLGVAA